MQFDGSSAGTSPDAPALVRHLMTDEIADVPDYGEYMCVLRAIRFCISISISNVLFVVFAFGFLVI